MRLKSCYFWDFNPDKVMSKFAFNLLLEERFEEYKNEERASKMKTYMRNQFEFYGIMATPRKEITKSVYRDLGVPENFIDVAKELFLKPQRELHYVAQELLLKCKRKWSKAIISDIEWFIQTNSWWDTVDFIASNLAGEYFKKWPNQISKYILEWNKSDDMWLVRSSILYQLKYKSKTDVSYLANTIQPHVNKTEFFIKKAIGWALREYSKTDPNWVLDFVESNKLQPLSKKEALKNF